MPWLWRTFIAYRDCPHLPITSLTCSLMDKWLVTVIPRILICIATDFILHLHLHCRSIEFAPVSVSFSVSRLSLQLFCLPSLMLRSLHLIEVESIIAKKKKLHVECLATSVGTEPETFVWIWINNRQNLRWSITSMSVPRCLWHGAQLRLKRRDSVCVHCRLGQRIPLWDGSVCDPRR